VIKSALANIARNTPIVRELMKRRYDRRFAINRHEQLYRGIFDTAAEAVASFPVQRLGYDNAESAGMYDGLMTTLESYDYPVLFWLGKLLREDPENAARGICDYGGHVGVKYYAYSPLLGDLPKWTVCDVAAAAKRGAEIASERGAYGLRFTSDIRQIADKGILLCLGALQYIEPTLAEQIMTASPGMAGRPKHVLINTTAFTDADEPAFYTLNSFGTSSAAYKIQNAAAFISQMAIAGYTLVDQWENPGRACSVPFQNERRDFKYLGMRFVRA
jgi:putative methyltransferase (TIGR04325 family)